MTTTILASLPLSPAGRSAGAQQQSGTRGGPTPVRS